MTCTGTIRRERYEIGRDGKRCYRLPVDPHVFLVTAQRIDNERMVWCDGAD